MSRHDRYTRRASKGERRRSRERITRLHAKRSRAKSARAPEAEDATFDVPSNGGRRG